MDFSALAKKFKEKKRYTSDDFDIIDITTGEIQNKEEIRVLLESGSRPLIFRVLLYEDINMKDLGIFEQLGEYIVRQ